MNKRNIYCTFCGHHNVSDSIRPKLRKAIETLIEEKRLDSPYLINFYVGNHGSFDYMSLGILRELSATYPNIKYSVVLAYVPVKKEEFSPIKREKRFILTVLRQFHGDLLSVIEIGGWWNSLNT